MGLPQLGQLEDHPLSGEIPFLGCVGKLNKFVLLEVVTQAIVIKFNKLGLQSLCSRGMEGSFSSVEATI